MALVAVIADTHMPRGRRRLGADCLRVLADAELILHAGDVTTAGVLGELSRLAPVQAVRGNIDDVELQAALPERLVVEIAGTRIGMIHDAGRRDGRAERLADAFEGCDAVVYGHTHLPEISRYGGLWILNPGSPTERRRAEHRSLIALHVGKRGIRPRVVELA
jgi:putative phosphoesterase